MKRGLLTIIISIIFLLGAISFAFRENWLFAVLFIITAILYFSKYVNKKGK
ncbi:hypothetical protein ACFTQ7_23850 [Lysinibacillus sp. NPDC056959]|uniref:hypothetical protein n=1 Tax=Lysinibacillus sp. NPDC056959 TaxID=3345981 RepID=UPI003630007E